MTRLRTLGTVRLGNGNGEEASAVLAQPKRLALLVYLALARPRGPQRRDTLLALFWPELDEAHARHALSQSLHFLRKCLGASAVVSHAEEVTLDPSQVACDVRELEDAVARGDVESALSLYEGEFLSGFHLSDAPAFDHWADSERARLRGMAVDAAHACAERAASSGQLAAAVAWAARAVALDPLNERAARRVMRARDAAGDRAGALREYREFTERLREELEAEPSPETHRLAETIRARSDAGDAVSGDFNKFRRSTAAMPPATASGAPPPSPESFAPPIRRSPRARAAAAIAFVAIVGITSVAISNTGPEQRDSLVVLAFDDMGGAGTDEYLGDGLAEDLTTLLSRVPGLAVSSRTSAFAYKGRQVDVREIGRALGVDAVLEGSVRRAGDSVRIAAQLVDAKTGYHLWSESYDRALSGIMDVQHDIMVGVAQALGLTASAAQAVAAGATVDARAYDAYLRGRHLLQVKSRARALAAIGHFQRAIALDSGYARAYAGLSDAYTVMAEFFPPREHLPMAKAAAERALRLDSSRVESHLAMGDMHLIHDRDWSAAERCYRLALRLDPASALAHERYARFLGAARRYDDHLRYTRSALALRRREWTDPVQYAEREHLALAAAYFAAQRYQEALEHGRAALELDPGSWAVNAVMGRTYVEMGRYDEGIAALELAWPASQQLPALARLGYAYGRAGRTADGRRVLAELLVRADTSYIPKDQIALVQLGLGDRDGAIASLWRAYEERHWWLPWVNQSPPFDALRGDERYQRLLRELGAP